MHASVRREGFITSGPSHFLTLSLQILYRIYIVTLFNLPLPIKLYLPGQNDKLGSVNYASLGPSLQAS